LARIEYKAYDCAKEYDRFRDYVVVELGNFGNNQMVNRAMRDMLGNTVHLNDVHETFWKYARPASYDYFLEKAVKENDKSLALDVLDRMTREINFNDVDRLLCAYRTPRLCDKSSLDQSAPYHIIKAFYDYDDGKEMAMAKFHEAVKKCSAQKGSV
jgi:hypothetical protein